MVRKTVEEIKRDDISELVVGLLGTDYLRLSIKKLTLTENYEKKTSTINCRFSENGTSPLVLKSKGCGLLDALHCGLVEHYREKYPSLLTLTFEGFSIIPDFSKRDGSGSDAEVEVVLKFANSQENVVTFREVGKSFVSASVAALFGSIEFYINAERAFRKLRKLIEEAKDRGRSDLVQGYVSKISTIVRVTSYEDVYNAV